MREPTFGIAVRNPAIGAGDPWATSGTQVCTGTAPSLYARPTETRANATASAVASPPLNPAAMPAYTVVPDRPNSRALPKRRLEVASPPTRKNLMAASPAAAERRWNPASANPLAEDSRMPTISSIRSVAPAMSVLPRAANRISVYSSPWRGSARNQSTESATAIAVPAMMMILAHRAVASAAYVPKKVAPGGSASNKPVTTAVTARTARATSAVAAWSRRGANSAHRSVTMVPTTSTISGRISPSGRLICFIDERPPWRRRGCTSMHCR